MARTIKKGTPRKVFRSLNAKQKTAVRKIAKNVVKGMAELKYATEYAYVGAEASYDDAQYALINDIIQGDGDSAERVGDQVRMTSLELRGFIQGVNNTAVGRLMVVLAKAGNQSLDTSASITFGLDELLFSGASSSAVWDVSRNDTRQRFQILYDRTFGTQDMAAGISSSVMHFHKIIPLKNKLCQYDAGTSRITKNAIFCIWFGNTTAVSNNGPLLSLTTKIRFIDL